MGLPGDTEVGIMGKLAEALEDMREAAEADFGYPEHEPQWIPAGSARVCRVCGMLDFTEPVTRLPSGVVWGRALGTRISDDAEEFYRQEQWS